MLKAAATLATVPLVIGVTSHRNIPAREVALIRQRVREFFAQLQRDFPTLPLLLLSPLAEGGDQLVAEEALAAGGRVVAPLPLPRELYVQDFQDPTVRAAFEQLRTHAQVVELPLLPGNSAQGIASPGVQRDRQYAQAGVFVARHCHLLLAIWDGKRPGRLGGTAQVVDYFLSGVMPGLSEHGNGGRRHLLGSGDERLVCQIVCSRDAADGAPLPPLQPGQWLWRAPTGLSAADAPMPAVFRHTFEHMAGFGADGAAFRADIEDGAAEGDTLPHGHVLPLPSAAALFRAADWLAMHFRQRVLLAMRIVYTLAAVMGVAFTIYDNLPDLDAFIYVFLLLFAAGALLSTIAKRRDWQRKYLDYRALAESLRVHAYWYRAGVTQSNDPEFSGDNFMHKQNIELGWTRNVMRTAWLGRALDPARAAGAPLQDVIREWLGDATHAGQLDYYRSKVGLRTRQHRLTERLGSASLLAGIAISIVLAALAHHLSVESKNVLIVIMAVFSIVAAVREAYAFKKADKELIKQYLFMQRIFGAARDALDRARSEGEQRDVLRALGEAALAEHAEWALMHRQRPLEHGKM